jgi:cytochrome c peroxidase
VKQLRTFTAIFAVALLTILGVTFANSQTPQDSAAGEYQWNLPKGFPKPKVPVDNPMTAAKVQLGRYLFYDQRISANGTQSCASCHKQELAFTDGKAQAVGATGELHSRGAMSIVNLAYSAALTWSNPTESSLEHQALTPMFGEHPVELGMKGKGDAFIQILRSDPVYREMFVVAFPSESDPFTILNITKAIACFERTIISARSPYDRYHYDRDDSAVSDSAKRGEVLFFSEPLSCFRCHGGFNFSDASDYEGRRGREIQFHNTGLYNVAGATSYPAPNTGIYEYTKQSTDVGKFKTPTLRNIALTAPYMHDGSIATLSDVIDHYAQGGRQLPGGPSARNHRLDRRIRPFQLSPQEKAELLAFLDSLTDPQFVTTH